MMFLQSQLVTNIPQQEVVSENMFSLLMKGGVVIIPILILSVVTVYLFVQKWMFIRNQAKIDQSFVDQVIYELRAGNLERAQMLAANNSCAIGRIVTTGVNQIGKPLNTIESMMESAINLEIAEMEKNNGYLGVIAGIAPMLGFIGTIAGVIKIFYNISMTDNVSIGIISGGLYQKMISSGTGLIVGVVAYTAYHLLNAEIDRFSLKVQRSTFNLLQSLQ
jgi:biopolymer transport protein ExbB